MPSFRLTVNGTEREVALPTLSVQHIVNGADILEADIQDELGSEVLSMDDVVILYRTDVSPETVYFEGLLQTTGNETWSGWGFSRLRKITAFDYGVYTSFVTVDALQVSTGGSPTDSLSSLLSTLVADYLTDYGVTLHPSQLTGPTLDPNAWDGDYIEAVLNAVSEQTGWVWKIDALKRLRMFDPATEAAGFNVTATNNTYIGDIKTNILRQRYYNRVFVEGGNGYHTILNEQHFGDGVKTTFEMNAPMHYFEVDYTASLGFMVGLVLLVTRTGGTTVEYANDQLTAQWSFNPGPDYSLTQVSGAVLGPTEYIVIPGYAAQYPMRLVADGRGSPPAPARDSPTIVRPSMFGRAAMQSIADTVLAASSTDFERISYLTDEVDILPGETQTVNVAEAGVNDTYTAINVRLAYVSGGDTTAFRREVTAVNAVTARSFWLDLYRRWLTDNQGVGSNTNTTTTAGTAAPVGPGLPLYSAQYNKNGVFGGAAGSEGAIYMRPDGGGPNQGVPDESALLALEMVDDAIALAIANMVAGRPSALTFRVEDDGSALIEHTDSLGFDIIEYGGQLGLIGATILASPNAASDGVSTGRLAHYWRHDSRALRRIRITSTTYTIDAESAGGGGTYSAWLADPTADAIWTLPDGGTFMASPSSGYGRSLKIRNISRTFAVTLVGPGSPADTIDGLTSKFLGPGQSVELIYLDGTNAGWYSFGDSAGIQVARVTLSNAQYKALPTAGVTLVPAPGAGFRINFTHAYCLADFAAGAYTGAAAISWIVLRLGAIGVSSYITNDNTASVALAYLTTFNDATRKTAIIVPNQETSDVALGWGLLSQPITNFTGDNAALTIHADNGGVDFGGGHASNTLTVTVRYTVDPA